IAAPTLSGLSFPTPGCHPDPSSMMTLCAQITQIYNAITTLAPQCFNPVPAWVATLSLTCDAPTLASGNNLCGNCGPGVPPFGGTCICDPSAAGCGLASSGSSCGVGWALPARQQMAICGASDHSPIYPTFNNAMTSIGQAFLSQPDNVVNGGAGTCRENVAIF